MPKYATYDRTARSTLDRPWEVHPIWRGIGCLMLFIIPVMAYAGAVVLIQEAVNRGLFPLPHLLAQAVSLPVLGEVKRLYAHLLGAVVLTVLGYSLMMVVYSLMYRVIGPPALGPLDAPPVRRR